MISGFQFGICVHLDCDLQLCATSMSRPLSRLSTALPLRQCNHHRVRLSKSISTSCLNSGPERRLARPQSRPNWCARGYAKVVPPPTTRGISQTEYELRRTLLINSLPNDSVCVLIGATMKYSSDSVLYIPSH